MQNGNRRIKKKDGTDNFPVKGRAIQTTYCQVISNFLNEMPYQFFFIYSHFTHYKMFNKDFDVSSSSDVILENTTNV